MTRAFCYFSSSTSRSRTIPSKGRSLVDIHRAHVEFIYIGSFVVFSIRDRRFQHFSYYRCRTACTEIEYLYSSLDWHTTDLVSHQSNLLWG